MSAICLKLAEIWSNEAKQKHRLSDLETEIVKNYLTLWLMADGQLSQSNATRFAFEEITDATCGDEIIFTRRMICAGVTISETILYRNEFGIFPLNKNANTCPGEYPTNIASAGRG